MRSFLVSLSFLVFTSLSIEASVPQDPSLIIVVNTAEWCPTCVKHGPRVEEDLLSSWMKNESYTVIINDLSSEASKKKSQKQLELHGLNSFTQKNNGTGRIYFLNPESKEVVNRVSVKRDNDKIKAELQEALGEVQS